MELYPIYDQNSAVSPNIWYSVSGLGEIPSMRVGHTMSYYSDKESSSKGKLYIIGGANPSGSFNEIYTLDMETLSWDKFDEMEGFEKGRYEHACLDFIDEANHRLFIFGGSNEDGSLNDLLEFDLNEKKCTQIKPESSCVPSVRTCHVSAIYKNQLVIFGGGETGKNAVNDAKLYIYNTKTRKWISLNIASGPSSRHGHVMLTNSQQNNSNNENKLYLHGGMNGEEIFDDLWCLDLKQLAWTKVVVDGDSDKRPCARAAHGGVWINQGLFIFGGLAQSGQALDDLWKFDIESKQWSKIEIFGHRPPSRLDFAYCKMKFKVSESAKQEEEGEQSSAVSTQQNQKDAYFMVIHGGMDTEGNIFDDLFFINLE